MLPHIPGDRRRLACCRPKPPQWGTLPSMPCALTRHPRRYPRRRHSHQLRCGHQPTHRHARSPRTPAATLDGTATSSPSPSLPLPPKPPTQHHQPAAFNVLRLPPRPEPLRPSRPLNALHNLSKAEVAPHKSGTKADTGFKISARGVGNNDFNPDGRSADDIILGDQMPDGSDLQNHSFTTLGSPTHSSPQSSHSLAIARGKRRT